MHVFAPGYAGTVFHTVSDRFSLKSIYLYLLCFISEEASLVSAEEREERLERRRALRRERASDRRARESAEEREERLSRRRAVERIGNESTVDREPRLLQMRTIHQRRITSSKMQQFHARLASLQSPKCVTCQERHQCETGFGYQ